MAPWVRVRPAGDWIYETSPLLQFPGIADAAGSAARCRKIDLITFVQEPSSDTEFHLMELSSMGCERFVPAVQ